MPCLYSTLSRLRDGHRHTQRHRNPVIACHQRTATAACTSSSSPHMHLRTRKKERCGEPLGTNPELNPDRKQKYCVCMMPMVVYCLLYEKNYNAYPQLTSSRLLHPDLKGPSGDSDLGFLPVSRFFLHMQHRKSLITFGEMM